MNGPAVKYLWTPPSPLPKFVPWLAVLALMLLVPNRAARAWWIVCPLAIVAVPLTFFYLAETVLPQISSLEKVFSSLAFGLAAVWLLASYLKHQLRFVTFVYMWLVCAIMGGFAFLVRQDWDRGFEVIGLLVYLQICVFLIVVSLSLAGLTCRRRYRPLVLTLWSAAFLTLIPMLIVVPIVGIGVFMSEGSFPWLEILGGIMSQAGACFVVLLAFLLLAFSNGFYRQRLKDLLHLEAAAVPPVLPDASLIPSPEPLKGSSI